MLNLIQIDKLVKGEAIKVGNLNNKIHYDHREGYYIVELFCFEENGEEMFEVLDGYGLLEDAVDRAKNVKSDARR